jgi:collagenase-like PrtC family protease
LRYAGRYPAVTGAFLNVCNTAAANIMARHGIERMVLPYELSLQSIASVASGCTAATEVVVHGHIPIAISRTCLTARSLGSSRQKCGRVCQRYSEGMVLEAQNQPLFRIEGPQTLSAATHCLVEYLSQLERAGVDTVRILPQWNHTASVVRIYRDVLDGRMQRRDAREELEALSPQGLCNGWLLGKAGWMYESPN